MINKKHILTTQELSLFSHKCLLDDRHDYIIEILKGIAFNNDNSIEDRILALYNLGDIYWNYIGDLDKAIEYINSAVEISDESDISFSHVLRGNLLRSKLNLLAQLGRHGEIETELERIINKYSDKGFANNSILYSAYLHKADLEYGKGNFKAALEYLNNAQICYPVKFYADKLHVVEITDYKNEYDNLKLLLSRNVCKTSDWQM